MKSLQALFIVVTIFVTVPIWYYILYKVLEATNATQLE